MEFPELIELENGTVLYRAESFTPKYDASSNLSISDAYAMRYKYLYLLAENFYEESEWKEADDDAYICGCCLYPNNGNNVYIGCTEDDEELYMGELEVNRFDNIAIDIWDETGNEHHYYYF